jgi:hypothetical protein
MNLIEKSLVIPIVPGNTNLLEYFRREVNQFCRDNNVVAIRFAVSETTETDYHCDLGVIEDRRMLDFVDNIFEFRRRKVENQNEFNAVVLVPTGIGCDLGGHSGDGGSMARLLASVCDNMITHPNVLNAADINEIPDNTLYCEGSIISRFLMGTVGLQKVRSNRVLVVVDEHEEQMFRELAINSVSAACVALGMDCAGIVKLNKGVTMNAYLTESDKASGVATSVETLVDVVAEYKNKCDVVAYTSIINVPSELHGDYFTKDYKTNPWGNVEAMVSHCVTSLLNVPVAHSPLMSSSAVYELDVGVVDPRKSAEVVSSTYLHCILKGLHRAPRIVPIDDNTTSHGEIRVEDISCIVMPDRCIGLPTLAALEHGIHVIAVRENDNVMKNDLTQFPFAKGRLHIVDNYLEAVGVMAAIKAGVAINTVRRPIAISEIIEVG